MDGCATDSVRGPTTGSDCTGEWAGVLDKDHSTCKGPMREDLEEKDGAGQANGLTRPALGSWNLSHGERTHHSNQDGKLGWHLELSIWHASSHPSLEFYHPIVRMRKRRL